MGSNRTGLQSIIHADTDPMFILADPDRAFELSNYPNKGWFDANGICDFK
jgi:hypothetical protein